MKLSAGEGREICSISLPQQNSRVGIKIFFAHMLKQHTCSCEYKVAKIRSPRAVFRAQYFLIFRVVTRVIFLSTSIDPPPPPLSYSLLLMMTL